MPTKTWKEHERRIAKLFGGRRVGPAGTATEDVEHPLYAIECKLRKRLPGWIKDAVAQAVGAAKRNKLPLVVLHETGRHWQNDLVVI